VVLKKAELSKPAVVFPSFIMEMKVNKASEILAQTRWYVMDAFQMLRLKTQIILGCEYCVKTGSGYVGEGTFSLKAFASPEKNDVAKLEQILIWEGKADAKSMGMIVEALIRACHHNVSPPKIKNAFYESNILIRFFFFFLYFCCKIESVLLLSLLRRTRVIIIIIMIPIIIIMIMVMMIIVLRNCLRESMFTRFLIIVVKMMLLRISDENRIFSTNT
jgi:hypothetical protein